MFHGLFQLTPELVDCDLHFFLTALYHGLHPTLDGTSFPEKE
jgi:hypothetical protein